MLSRRLSNQVKLGLTRYPYRNVPDLLEDCVHAAVDSIIERGGGPAFDDAGYARLRGTARASGLTDVTVDIVVTVEKIVAAARDVELNSPLGPTGAGPVHRGHAGPAGGAYPAGVCPAPPEAVIWPTCRDI